MILSEAKLTIQPRLELFSKQFDTWLELYLSSQVKKINFVDSLWQSKSYSLRSGGKRFRPFLASLVYQIWQSDLEKIKNFCLAIEMIHTYSLIHDDLPCMDNDDLRRGKPTNHKVYGEATALLAGDALLTEAFQQISGDIAISAEQCVQLIRLLSDKIGSFGMVGGQVLDMNVTDQINLAQLEQIHLLKTGYLIQAAAEGAAVLANVNSQERKTISDFALNLGLAFQIKDDLLDANDKEQDYKSYLSVLGNDETLKQLQQKSNTAKQLLLSLKLPNTTVLIDLIDYNLQRTS